jgi:hypothetical protein
MLDQRPEGEGGICDPVVALEEGAIPASPAPRPGYTRLGAALVRLASPGLHLCPADGLSEEWTEVGR